MTTTPPEPSRSGTPGDQADGHRVEHDALGEVLVPSSARWQAQTQRAVENFPVSGRSVRPELIAAIVEVKAAAASSNEELGVVSDAVAGAIRRAAAAVLGGEHRDQFPVDVFQTGSGTSSNMNVNEVLSTLATEYLGEPVHPNDHVNASQSSNDVFPTAIRLAAARAVTTHTIPGLEHLAGSLRERETAFAEVVKSGRTHLMDAVPITLGQEFGGYATAVELGVDRIRSTLDRLCSLPLGGTAVGTGLNAPEGFAAATIDRLADTMGLPLTEASDHFEAQGGQDVLVELSGACRVVAVSLNKIANDLRWMASGPSTGLSEIFLPELQPGSSIMPGKVNPVLPEAVNQVVAQVVGNDAAIAFGGAAGTFELNVMMPVMADCLLDTLRILGSVSRLLADRCVSGIRANEEMCRRYAESSPSLVTALVPVVGYEAAASAAKQAVAERRTVRDVVLERGLATAEELDRALDPLGMTRGGRRTDQQ